MRNRAFELNDAPAPTFENFAPGRNSEALALLRRALAGQAAERCVYLWGPRGSGKTHLLRAAVALSQARGNESLYVQASNLAATEAMPVLPSLLALDDVHRAGAADQAALFRLFQRLRDDSVLLLATGDDVPAGLALRDDVRTRLGAGLVYQLHVLSDAEKVDALARHAHARGFTLATELSEYLLRHEQRDLASLMQVLDALDRYSLETKRSITLPLLRELLQLEE